MKARQNVLRNREAKLKNENFDEPSFKGVTTRKRAALKALENNSVLQDGKVFTKPATKINAPLVKEESKFEPMDIPIDNKENEFISYENLISNQFVWPSSSEIDTPEQRADLLNTFILRRKAIRLHYKELNNDGNPYWFPNDSVYRDEYMHGDYLANIHDYLMEIEATYNPLGQNFLENSAEVDARRRYIFVNFIVHMHSLFSMCAETLQLTIALSDRFIKAQKTTICVSDLIIVGLVCMFIAAKIEEVWPPSLNELLEPYKLDYTPEFCKKLEVQIISTLDCKLSIPLPISPIRHYNILIEGSTLSHYLSRYFCELSLQDYVASGHSINFIASSCVFLAQVICQSVETDFHKVWNEKLQTSSGLIFSDIKPLVRNLCIIVSKQSASSNYRAISMKYSSDRLMNVYNKSLSSVGFRNIVQYFKSESLP